MTYEPTPTPPPEIIVPGSTEPDRQGVAIASLVLGILSVLISCFWFCSMPLALGGIITGILGLKSSKKGLAIAGLILSGLAVLISIVFIIIGFAWMQSLPSDFNFDFGNFENFVP